MNEKRGSASQQTFKRIGVDAPTTKARTTKSKSRIEDFKRIKAKTPTSTGT